MTNKQYQQYQQSIEPEIMYDFDPDEYVQTIIQQQVEYRIAKATANLAISISLILLFICGGMGAMLLTTAIRSGEPTITK